MFILRTAGRDPASLAADVRMSIWSVDSGVPVFDIRPMTDVIARSLGERRFAVSLLTGFALVALVLAVAGLYSVLSFAVAQRTAELGVRLAIGATPMQVLTLVLGEGLRLTATGLVVGMVLGAALARLLSHLLFGVSPFDPWSFSVAAILMLVVSLLASGGPARRAARLDPLAAFRAE